MIHRSQSVYLLLVTMLMSFMLISAYAEISLSDGNILTFRPHMIEKSSGNDVFTTYRTTFPLVFLAVMTGLLSLVNIFLFSKRIVQMRICIINMVLLGLMLITMYAYYSAAKNAHEVSLHAFRLSAIFPVVSIVLHILAYRQIHSDELLVNSYNRIR